jgi:hypothetical protein
VKAAMVFASIKYAPLITRLVSHPVKSWRNSIS